MELQSTSSNDNHSMREFLLSQDYNKENYPNSNDHKISRGHAKAEYANKFRESHLQRNFRDSKQNKSENVLLEVEIIYKEEDMNDFNMNQNFSEEKYNRLNKNKQGVPLTEHINKTTKSNFFNSGLFGDQSEIDEETISLPMEMYKHSAIMSFPKNRTAGTFIENELKKSGDCSKNYVKIELRVNRNKINLETMLNCFEYFSNENVDFHFDKENLISYFYAFSICQMDHKRKEVLDRLLLDLNEENIIYFVKAVSSLNDEFLNSYCFWLLRHLANQNEKLDEINYNGYNYGTIVKLSNGHISFDKNNKIIYIDNKFSLSANLNFLKGYFSNLYAREFEKYYKPNNYFNIGKILRRKSDEKIIYDYPHYFQMVLENDPSLMLYAIRSSENSSFILSRSIDDFNKYGVNYIGEVVPNFWGTFFEVWDNGYEKTIYEKTNEILANPRRLIGNISYETNIMGECPRYFKLEILQKGEVHRMANLKPEWNDNLECYCLNFYGRVKKASAKNFQIIYPDDPDNIIFQHGKVSKDEFNLDFREPFNYVYAFAVSLAAIGKKRVVS